MEIEVYRSSVDGTDGGNCGGHISRLRRVCVTTQEAEERKGSLSGNKVGCEGPCVVVDWIGQMVSKVLYRSLTSDNSYYSKSRMPKFERRILT
jgi:hypothetical protein